MTTEEAQPESQPATPKSVAEAWQDLEASLCALLPEEFWVHAEAARREVLLAVRSLIDAAIEHAEGAEKPQRKRAQKIKIE